MAPVICTAMASGSVTRVAPAGSVMSPAWIAVPAWAPARSTSIEVGIEVASTSTESVFSTVVIRVPAAALPTWCSATSTVTFSPRRTSSRSTCSIVPRMASRWIAFGSASVGLPSTSRVSRAFDCLSASMVAWPGSETCTGSVPWP